MNKLHHKKGQKNEGKDQNFKKEKRKTGGLCKKKKVK